MTLSQAQELAIKIKNQYDKFNLQRNNKKWTLSAYMAGFVGDVGDLSKLVMAKEGYRDAENLDDKIEHEIVDCLCSIFVVADELGLDIQELFPKHMDSLEQRVQGMLDS